MTVEMIEKGILITFDELRVLLFGKGVTEIEGVYMPEKKWSEEEILTAMHHMAKMGFIEAEETRFRMRPDIDTMLEIIAHPEWTQIFSPLGEEGPQLFLYQTKEKIVISELVFSRKDTLKLSLLGREEFEKWREELENDYRGD